MLVLRLSTKVRDYDTVYQLTQNALKEDPMAELSLAAIYEGNGNMENVGKVYRIAASHEEPYAMKRCGDLHMGGTGLPPDGDLAVKMYADAAAAGERTAMYELGRCADAFEQDREKMAFWFAKAHIRGHRLATEEMRKLIYN
jgi:TPR repeat protein